VQLAGRGQSNDARAFNAQQKARADVAGLLLAFVEQAPSSTLTNGDGSSGSLLKAAAAALAMRQKSQQRL
jgi:hypothetical protein